MKHTFRKSIDKGNKKGFFRRHYKEIIVVLIGIIIGTCIGSVGRVSESLVDKANSQIEDNKKTIKSKEEKLKTLENTKLELKESLKK